MFKKYLVSLMVCCASVWAVDLSIESVDTDAVRHLAQRKK